MRKHVLTFYCQAIRVVIGRGTDTVLKPQVRNNQYLHKGIIPE